MAQSAVLFDLFGTLVRPYSRTAHTACVTDAAVILGVDAEVCLAQWRDTWPQRARGELATIEENLRLLAPSPDSDAVATAADRVRRFTIDSLEPQPGALELLDRLAAADIATAVVSNCAPDVAQLWPTTAFAARITETVLSCEVGAMKPDPAIYRIALDRLGIDPSAAVFVGDGSDDELSGARQLGIAAILVDVDHSDTYDPARGDVHAWDGPRVAALAHLSARFTE